MKECENRIALLPLPNGRFPFTEAEIISAQEKGFKEGWRAALEWAVSIGNMGGDIACDDINKELGEK